MGFQQQEQNLSDCHDISRTEIDQFHTHQEQQHQSLLRYQQMHLNHWQSQIAVGNDGTGFVQSQSPTPNLFRQDRQLSLGEFQEQQVVHQEEQVPPHQVQLHNFESRHLLPTHPPNLSRPDAAMGWNAMATTAASTTHSPGWWISQEISYPNHQSFDRDLSPYTLAKSPWEDTSTTTGPASDIGTGTTSRKRSITTVALDNGNNNADKSTESIEGHTDCDPNNNAKRSIRSERKRELEKQRRLDLNERYNTLITVLSRIEKEDEQRDMQPSNQDEERAQSGSSESDPSEQGNGTEKSPSTTQSETGPQENSARTAAAMTSAARLEHKRLFPTHISSSNRADLIARTVSHLALYGRIRKQQESTIRSLKDKLKEMERNRAENERKLKDIEGYGGAAAAATMAQPLAIPLSATVGDGGKDTTVKSKPELESVDGHSPSPSVESMIVGRQQQQQQQMMTMMVPIMVGMNYPSMTSNTAVAATTDNTTSTSHEATNTSGYMRCIPMPMPSMGAQQFCNMMMRASPSPSPAAAMLSMGLQQQSPHHHHLGSKLLLFASAEPHGARVGGTVGTTNQ